MWIDHPPSKLGVGGVDRDLEGPLKVSDMDGEAGGDGRLLLEGDRLLHHPLCLAERTNGKDH